MASNSSDREVSAGPSTTPTRPSPNLPQRKHIYKDWIKDEKIKTAKCKICGERVKKFCHQCGQCKSRICSECSEADGANSDKHKAVARDHIDHGCWCGFPTKFNPAFKDSMPSPKMRDEAPKAPATSGRGKRKRGQPSRAAIKQEEGEEEDPFVSPPASTTPNVNTNRENPDDPFVDRQPTKPPTPYFFVKPKQHANESAQPAGDDDLNSSKSADRIKEPARKRRKPERFLESEMSTLTEFTSGSSENEGPSTAEQTSPENLIKSAASASSSNIEEAQEKRPSRAAATQAASSPNGIGPSAGQSSTIPKTRTSAPKPVRDQNVVIIGAGIMGLFTALQLAQKAAATGKKQKITVVDINNEPFALASGHSAGFLTTHGIDEQSMPLMTAAVNEWNDLTESKEFRKAVRFNQSVYTTTDDEQAKPHALSWFRCNDDEFTTPDCASLSMISPAGLAEWLHKQCESNGVQFRFNCHPTELKKDRSGNTIGIIIQPVDLARAKPETLTCSDLVLAAGAFTPDLFNRLFPASHVKPANSLQLAQWIRYEGLNVTARRPQGVIVPDAEPGCGLTGYISAIAKPSRQAMVVSGSQSLVSSRRLGPHDALASPLRSTTALQKLAGKHLAAGGVPGEFAGNDASYISCKPVLGEVGGVGAGVKVWLCYGFGMHGTTMGPGAGKVMAELVMGEGPSVDLSGFEVGGGKGEVVGSMVSSGYKGKGKGKARS